MNTDFVTNKRNKLFLLTLIVTVVFIVASSYSLALNSASQEDKTRTNLQNDFPYNSVNQNGNYLTAQKFNNVDLETSDYDLLDYDDYVKLHRILDHSNINLYINHLTETFITRKTSSLYNLFPQYPPMEKIIRLKNFLI